MASLWSSVGKQQSLYYSGKGSTGFAKGSHVTLKQFLNNVRASLNDGVQSKLFIAIIDSLAKIAESMYETRAFFRTGGISEELKRAIVKSPKRLILSDPTFNKRKPFHYQETGFTSRAKRWIPGRFFFYNIIREMKTIFIALCNKVALAIGECFNKHGGSIRWIHLKPYVTKAHKEIQASLTPINKMILQKNLRRSQESQSREESWRRERGIIRNG